MGRERDRLAHGQTERPPCTRADRETALHTGRQRDRLAHGQTERPLCTWADRETALHTGRQRDRLAHGQTERPKDHHLGQRTADTKKAKRTKHAVYTYRLGVGRGTLVAVVVMT